MIEHLKQKYLEEAHDLLLDLEKTLLLLEEHPADPEGVETAFRVMHTLKGSSGMFGYHQVSELVHLLESVYDAVRNGALAMPEELLGLSLEAVDHIRQLLREGASDNASCQLNHKLLLKNSAEMLYDLGPVPSQDQAFTPKGGLATWAIYFAPEKNMLRNGSNPLYLMEELAGFGELHAFPSTGTLPDFNSLDPHACYLSWVLLVVTESSKERLQETFLFVEDLCELRFEQLAIGNVLSYFDANWQQHVEERLKPALTPLVFDRLAQELREMVRQNSGKGMAEKQYTGIASGADQQKTGAASIRVASDKLDDLMNMISELVTNQARLSLLAEQSFQPELLTVAEEIEKITRRLRDKTFDICLIPIGSMLTRFKRLVRDLSLELNKKIVFEAEGVDTELDKNVIEHLSECLVHIFRNSIDHGIEDEATRLAQGKEPQGQIRMKAYNYGTNVILEIQDDGAGIDAEKVKAKAIQKGLVEEDQELSEQEIYNLLFLPGFSTASQLTEVSGRGVGMDVVRKKIKELRGDVQIASNKGKGTTTIISLPLTISIIDGLLVRVADTNYVLPLSFVEKSYLVTREDVNSTFNNQLILEGEPIPFFNLTEVFSEASSPDSKFAILVKTMTECVALLVDEILGEYQAVLKPLGKFYQQQEFLSGGSLQGDGTIALVIDPHKLIQQLKEYTNPT